MRGFSSVASLTIVSILTAVLVSPLGTLKVLQQVIALGTPTNKQTAFVHELGQLDWLTLLNYISHLDVSLLMNGIEVKIAKTVISRLSNFFLARWVTALPIRSRSLIFGCIAFIITYPLEFIYTLLSLDLSKERFLGPADVLEQALERGGTSFLYTGIFAGVLGIITQQIFWNFLMESTNKLRSAARRSVVSDILISAFLSVAVTLFSHPFDTIMSVQIVTGTDFPEATLLILSNYQVPGFWNGAIFAILSTASSLIVTRFYYAFGR